MWLYHLQSMWNNHWLRSDYQTLPNLYWSKWYDSSRLFRSDVLCEKASGSRTTGTSTLSLCRDEEHLSGVPFTQNLQFIMNKEYLLQLRISTFCCKANAYTDDVTIYVDKIYYLLLAATYIQSEDMTLNAPCHMSDACQAKQSYRRVFHDTFDPFSTLTCRCSAVWGHWHHCYSSQGSGRPKTGMPWGVPRANVSSYVCASYNS